MAFGRNLFLVSALLLAFRVSAALTSEGPRPATDEETRIVEDPARGLVGAVFLDIQRVSSGWTYSVRVRAKVLSKNGYDVATVEGLEGEVKDVRGWTIGTKGLVTALAREDVRTTTATIAGVKLERKSFTLPALEPGCLVEYAYTEHGSFGSGSDLFLEIPFQAKYPILRQELRLPLTFSAMSREQNGVAIEYREEKHAGIFTAASAPALRDEPYGLPKRERSALVIVSQALGGLSGQTIDAYWENATKEVLTPLVKDRMIRPSRLRDRLKAIPQPPAPDSLGRIRALYEFVRASVKNRWVLRADETAPKGGWKKNEGAGDALERGEGSPQDLALVFASLLRADGWDYQIVFAPDREIRLFRRDVRSPFQFHSWLVLASDPKDPSKSAVVSFEHPLLAFGEVPWNHLGVDCWAVDVEKAAGSVVRFPMPPNDRNRRRGEWKLVLTAEREGLIEREDVWSGLGALEMRSQLYRLGRPRWEKEAREEYRKLDPPAKLESADWQSDERPGVDLKRRIRASRSEIASVLPGDRLELSPLAMLARPNPFTREERKGPVFFPYPYVDEDTLSVTAPPGWELEALPASLEQDSAFGRYAVVAERGSDGAVIVRRRFELKKFWGAVGSYPAYKSLFEASARGDDTFSLVFRKGDAAKR